MLNKRQFATAPKSANLLFRYMTTKGQMAMQILLTCIQIIDSSCDSQFKDYTFCLRRPKETKVECWKTCFPKKVLNFRHSKMSEITSGAFPFAIYITNIFACLHVSWQILQNYGLVPHTKILHSCISQNPSVQYGG